MSIKLGTNISIVGGTYLDSRQLVYSKEELINWINGEIEGFEVYLDLGDNPDTGWYLYQNSWEGELGHFLYRVDSLAPGAINLQEDFNEFSTNAPILIDKMEVDTSLEINNLLLLKMTGYKNLLSLKVDVEIDKQLISDSNRQKLNSIEEGAQVNATELPNPFKLAVGKEGSGNLIYYDGSSAVEFRESSVLSINGKVGDVIVDSALVNVLSEDDAPNILIPVSNLPIKVLKEFIFESDEPKVLSEVNFTSGEVTKLDGIEVGAEKNPESLPNPFPLNITIDEVLTTYNGGTITNLDILRSSSPLPIIREESEEVHLPPQTLLAVEGQFVEKFNTFTNKSSMWQVVGVNGINLIWIFISSTKLIP